MEIKKLVKLYHRINLKLAPYKFSQSTAVKFGGEDQGHLGDLLDPPDSRILAVTEMETLKTKKELQHEQNNLQNNLQHCYFPSV